VVTHNSPRRSARASNAVVTDALPDGAPPRSAVSRTVEDFDEMYTAIPPWDIGRPQPVFLALAEAGAMEGSVLDAGCGTGEHVLMAAARGLDGDRRLVTGHRDRAAEGD